VSVSGRQITVKGPKGSLDRQIPGTIEVAQEGEELLCTRISDTKQDRALHGLTRSLINNMVIGVTEGYVKELDIVGVGYRAIAKGKNLELALGFSHPVNVDAPDGIEFEIPGPTKVLVKGIDKELVGQTAADIRAWRKPEPYKGKGIRYTDEYVIRKAGKAAK